MRVASTGHESDDPEVFVKKTSARAKDKEFLCGFQIASMLLLKIYWCTFLILK